MLIHLIMIGCLAHPTIKAENRLHNPDRLCWWCCAEMIGREANIATLKGLRDRVVHDGYGSDGATSGHIKFWMDITHTKYEFHHPPYTQRDYRLLTNCLDRNILPIVTIDINPPPPPGQIKMVHAVILIEITAAPTHWTDANGNHFYDYLVSYIDPDRPDIDMMCTWNWFWEVWTGETVIFQNSKDTDGGLHARSDYATPP